MLKVAIWVLAYLKKQKRLDFCETLLWPSKRPCKELENAPRIIINCPNKSDNNKQSQEQHISSTLTDDINKTENEIKIVTEKKTYDEVKLTINKN